MLREGGRKGYSAQRGGGRTRARSETTCQSPNRRQLQRSATGTDEVLRQEHARADEITAAGADSERDRIVGPAYSTASDAITDRRPASSERAPPPMKVFYESTRGLSWNRIKPRPPEPGWPGIAMKHRPNRQERGHMTTPAERYSIGDECSDE